LSLAYCSSLFACLTHYGTGSAPILFGSEYVNIKVWWRMGAFISVLFLIIWVGIGSLWWKLLGLW
jgi:divalent anion:Na+ symporter, DASS family